MSNLKLNEYRMMARVVKYRAEYPSNFGYMNRINEEAISQQELYSLRAAESNSKEKIEDVIKHYASSRQEQQRSE